MGNKHYALWLSLICIIVFVLQMAFSGFTDAFVLDESSFMQPWRFITAIFLHGGLAHLLFNMFALALFGSILETIIGSRKFLYVFFASGIIANLIAVNYYPSSLGASGAIYGILGALIMLKPMLVVWLYGIPMPMFIAGVLWVAGAFLGLFYPSDVGHIAHLSGMGIGLVLGMFYRQRIRNLEAQKYKIVFDENSVRRWEEENMK